MSYPTHVDNMLFFLFAAQLLLFANTVTATSTYLLPALSVWSVVVLNIHVLLLRTQEGVLWRKHTELSEHCVNVHVSDCLLTDYNNNGYNSFKNTVQALALQHITRSQQSEYRYSIFKKEQQRSIEYSQNSKKS